MSFEDVLGGLRERFVAGSRERCDRIERLLDQLDSGAGGAQTVRDLMMQFHGFSGSGSTYGFPRVSILGSEGERLCEALVKGPELAGARERKRWRSLLLSLRRELEAAQAKEAAAPPAVFRTPFDILIVDADPGARAALTRLAGGEGMTTREAGSRAEAMAELSRRLPNGAIVESRLPEGPGFELVEHLRRLPAGDSLAILMVGEPSSFANRVDAIHCGADGYFDKPLRPEVVMRRLEHLLERGRSETPRILSVEDDPDQADFIRGVMESAGYSVRVCSDPTNLDSDLSVFRPDLVLLDVQLPGTDGFAIARLIRQQEAHAALPILFLTTRAHLDSQIESMRAGGDDYLVKPVAPGLLLSAAAARIERARFLKSLLERDGLTRLLTHTAFLERARAMAEERSRDPRTPVAMILVDLDGFKSLNDRYGHPTGDAVLCSLAGLMRRRVRQSDLVGRLGGDEFAAIIENIREKEAVRLLERMRQEFSGMDHASADGSRFQVTFSAGMAMLEPGMDAGLWRERADAALYSAKSKGRNRIAAAGA